MKRIDIVNMIISAVRTNMNSLVIAINDMKNGIPFVILWQVCMQLTISSDGKYNANDVLMGVHSP